MKTGTKLRRWAAISAMVAVVASIFVAVPQSAQALSGSQFDPGYIISDAVFFNEDAMTEAQIQVFLEGKLPTCAEANGYKCLKNFTETTPDRAASTGGNCAFYQGAADERASAIIYKVAQACGINPQVLLVTLQKERSLVTKGSPTAGDYKVSMGYACPDTAACDTRYFGFYNQVYSAAWQFKQYAINASRWRYHIGAVSIAYAPTASCGASVVTIRNQATANLYNYTPYQPDAAALANLNGQGVLPCSSHGNRNFWVFFNTWFGSSIGAVDPIGSLDIVSAGPGSIRVAGWVFDPDTKDATSVHVYVNGVGRSFGANNERPDLPPVYGDIGTQHGFDVTVPIESSGPQTVCVYGINWGPGANSSMGCRTLQVLSGSPIGIIDTLTASRGMITVTGWTLDPDTVAPIPVHIYNGASGVAVTADVDKPDLASSYPGYGTNHGFTATFPATAGVNTVCVYGINIAGTGANSNRGCQSISVPTGSPIGIIDSLTAAGGQITIKGWTLDPDVPDSIPVHVYTDNAGVVYTANADRPDIALAYPGYGAAHGYEATYPATPGKHTVCVYGINIAGTGANSNRGCGVVTVPTGSPIGIIDSLTTAPGQITITGWTLDPDTVASIPVHIYTDSSGLAFTADVVRPDLAIAYPGYGPNHGYSATFAATPGQHSVCVYAIEMAGTGGNSMRGCRVVVVP